ncbi:MAG: hypothetical protein ABIQ02_15660 [Saprospiraceae bacterium]
MKFSTTTSTHYFLLPVFLISAALLFSSCSSKMQFAISPVEPAAEGWVSVKNDKNNNYTVQLKVKNLASPERLTPPSKEYVVWAETRENSDVNIGRLKSTSGMWTTSKSGSLKTVMTSKPTAFFITAEDDGSTTYPGRTVVLRTK